MKEMVKGILDTWILFWGSGYYQYLILLAVLLLLLFFRKRNKTSYCIFGAPACAIFLSPECRNYTEMYWQ